MRMRTFFAVAAFFSVSSLCATSRAQLPQQLHQVDVNGTATEQSSRLTTQSTEALVSHDYQRAVREAEQAIAADPSDAYAYYDKGVALIELGDYSGADTVLAEAEDKFAPDDGWGRAITAFARQRAAEFANGTRSKR